MTFASLSTFTKKEKESHEELRDEIRSKLHKNLGRTSVKMVKHIYIIHGEPRVGKTTLGQFSSLSHIADMLDTDQFESTELLPSLLEYIEEFLQKKDAHAAFIVLGKHRAQTLILLSAIKKKVQKKALLSQCHVSRV